ncbi:MAG TPA: polyprenyl diphosphate synthase [Patescibacteria group bacterium]
MAKNGHLKSPFGKDIKVPRHIVFIPDGNRRWAREHNLPIEQGHEKGMEAVMNVAEAAQDWGVKYFTVWCFSTENWDRTRLEIKNLMRLFKRMIEKHLKEFIKRGVKVIHLGRKDRIPGYLKNTIDNAVETTKNNNNFVLNLALDYGGRDEIIRAIRRIVTLGKDPNKINEKEFKQYLDTNGTPEPDLIIRTSGEQRLSGIMAYQAVYAELYFEKSHCPDFTVEKLKTAILDYSSRQRRFGK